MRTFAHIENEKVVNLSVWEEDPPAELGLVETTGTDFGVGDIYSAGQFAKQVFVPQPAGVPQSVSRFQARAALHQAGHLPAVEAMMADPATPMLAKLAWQDAQEFKRTSPTVLQMGAALGLSESQLDDLFIAAAQIQA